jgi:Protein of unknown function (DUF2786)
MTAVGNGGDANRNSIIEKIKALLAKTTANGATEAEMLSALDKAAAMRDAYDISDAELQIAKDEAAILHADPPDLKDPHKIKWRLSYGIAQFCGVQIYRSVHETGLKCIGMPSDLKELELENSRLRKAVSDLTLDKLILTEAARGNF